ncbi:MAG TPA: hypothetical protein VGE74_14400 [Gemmata sp.]
MTLADWLDCADHDALCLELSLFSDRKLHLLTAALLRRVWDQLPSHHTRLAVAATEKFADGLITAHALAWARSQAARDEFGDSVWLARGAFDDFDLLNGGQCCPDCDWRAARYGCRVAKQGGILDGARDGIDEPAWVATGAAFRVLSIENPADARTRTSAAWQQAWENLFGLVREVLGEDGSADRFAPEWRTSDVRALARGIYEGDEFDQLPILADALQDAGCDDEAVLVHCRSLGGHVRGCWALDLAMGFQ